MKIADFASIMNLRRYNGAAMIEKAFGESAMYNELRPAELGTALADAIRAYYGSLLKDGHQDWAEAFLGAAVTGLIGDRQVSPK